jgi:hypothetical protein
MSGRGPRRDVGKERFWRETITGRIKCSQLRAEWAAGV